MAVKLRLMRMGKKGQPTYRVVVADGRSPRDGRFIEIVGTYNPRLEPSGIKVDNDKAVAWLKKGAQPVDLPAGPMASIAEAEGDVQLEIADDAPTLLQPTQDAVRRAPAGRLHEAGACDLAYSGGFFHHRIFFPSALASAKRTAHSGLGGKNAGLPGSGPGGQRPERCAWPDVAGGQPHLMA